MKLPNPLAKFDSQCSAINDFGKLILRVLASLAMMLSHGLGKLKNFEYLTTKFSDPLGIGSTMSITATVFAEFFCALFLIVGLCSRFCSAVLAFTMGVAFFVVHNGDAFKDREMAFIYGIIFIMLAVSGPGKYSIDRLIRK